MSREEIDKIQDLNDIKLTLARMNSQLTSEFKGINDKFDNIEEFMNQYYGDNSLEKPGMPIRVDRLEQELKRMNEFKSRLYKLLGGLSVPILIGFGKAVWDVVKSAL